MKRQQGVVIIVALFMVALVAGLSYMMLTRLQRDTERTTLILRHTQAEFYAQGAIAWAMDVLRNNWEKQKPNERIDTLPIQSPVDEVNGYKISSVILDMQGRYNLNLLVNPDAIGDFKRLVQAVAPNMPEDKVQEIARAAVDWVTPLAATAQNEFSQYYLGLPVPYRAAHRFMLSSSELRLVKGMTPALFAALQPYVTALPEGVPLNIQSAEAPALLTLAPSLNLDTAKALQSYLIRTPVASKEILPSLDVIKNHHIDNNKIAITSSYFLVETLVTIENQRILLYTLLERTLKDNRLGLRTVWQSKGIW